MFKIKISIILLSVILSSSSFASDSDPSSILQLSLVPRENSIEFGETYWVDMYIKNNGNEPVIICNCNIIGTNYIKEESNPSAKMVEDVYRTDVEPTKTDFFTVAPRGSFHFGATGLDKNYLCNPGKWSYSLRNKFISVRTPSGGKSWAGVLNSNTVTINVVGNKKNN